MLMLSAFSNYVIGRSRTQKRALAVTVDIALVVAATLTAFYLRLGVWVMPQGLQWVAVLVSLALALPIFLSFGMYRAIFRYAGGISLESLTFAGSAYAITYASIFTFIGIPTIPRTVGLIQPLLLLLSVAASRSFIQLWLGGQSRSLLRNGKVQRVLIYGAGSAGRQLSAALSASDHVHVVGFIDDDTTLHGSILSGKRIYAADQLRVVVERNQVNQVLLALPSATRQRRNEILTMVRGMSVDVKILPGIIDMVQGRFSIEDLRPVELEDLLGRDAVAPNQILLARKITGKTVVVTGAGGSIGGELCKQIVVLQPAKLILVEINEYGLYRIHQDLLCMVDSVESLRVQIVPVLASVLDAVRMAELFAQNRPQTIYHAAAYKHVPLVEANPIEGIRNNALGTLAIAEAAAQHRVDDFVLVSTDKAVRPTNIMGASKRLAELVIQAIADRNTGTSFSMVRFGNVLGSSGSVVPLFRDQINKGGPVTITHEEVTRYFMTLSEAAQLVIQAGAMARGGEVFVLDMGEPVKIIDLAQKMIELSGLAVRDDDTGEGDIDIVTIGLRPGEKLYEELLIGANEAPTTHPRIMMATEIFVPWPELVGHLAVLKSALGNHDLPVILNELSILAPEYVMSREMTENLPTRRSVA